MRFLSHYYHITWPSGLTVGYSTIAGEIVWDAGPKCGVAPLKVTHLWHCVCMLWWAIRKNKQTCHAANQQKTASEQMPERCLLWCQQLTPKPHTGSQSLTLAPATKAVSGQTPGEITLPPLHFQAFQQGWLEDRGPDEAAGGSAMFL